MFKVYCNFFWLTSNVVWLVGNEMPLALLTVEAAIFPPSWELYVSCPTINSHSDFFFMYRYSFLKSLMCVMFPLYPYYYSTTTYPRLEVKICGSEMAKQANVALEGVGLCLSLIQKGSLYSWLLVWDGWLNKCTSPGGNTSYNAPAQALAASSEHVGCWTGGSWWLSRYIDPLLPVWHSNCLGWTYRNSTVKSSFLVWYRSVLSFYNHIFHKSFVNVFNRVNLPLYLV